MKSKKFFTGVALGIALLGTTGMANANLITNGSFELGSNLPTGSFRTLSSADSTNDDITGWTITSGTVDWINSYWTASDGTKSLDLSGLSQGTIASASFSTIIGNFYNVYFDMAGNDDGPPKVKTLQATVDPLAAIHSFTFDTTGKSNTNMGWITQSFSFIATSTTTTLSFGDLSINVNGGEYYGAALDNVIVEAAPVPEPATMLLFGAGLMGLAGRRALRKKK